MSENNDLFAKMFPDIKTDHGGINLGDVIVLIITAAMLIFTGFRSWDIIRQTVPPGWDIVAYAGLLALDGGMLAWSLVWIFGSTTPYQDWIALSMWGVDVVGVGLAAIADTFFYAPGGATEGMVQTISNAVWWVVPALAILNTVMGTVYHFTHPVTIEHRRERRLRHELAMQAQVGRYHLLRQEMQAEQARDLITQRQQVLEAYARLVEQKRQQDALERALIGKLLGSKDAAATLDEAVRKVLDGQVVNAHDGDGQVGTSPVPVVTTGGSNHRGATHYTPNADDAPLEPPSNPTINPTM